MNDRLAAAPRGLLLLLIIGATTCGRQPNVPVAKPSATASPEFVDLGPARVAARVGKLQTDLSALEERVSQLEPSDAAVSTEEKTYGIANTKFGPFVIVALGVTPYLDGFKVKLSIGNLTSATFHGGAAKVKVSWGVPEEGKAGQERTLGLTTDLRPGTMSEVEVVLAPAKPEEIKLIRVGLELSRLSLRRR